MDNKPTPPPDPTKGWPSLLLLAVAMFGPPSVAVLKFTQAVTQNPWLTVLLIVAYEILVALVSIVSGVWQQLKDSWVKQLASAIDTALKNAFSRYYHHYRRYFFYEHRDLDVKGLSTQGTYTLYIQDVFVELCIESKAAHQASPNPLRLPEELHTESRTIWEYLRAKALEGQHLVILGAPGSGKTTLLRHLGLSLIYHKRSHQIKRVPYKLPLLLFLRDHARAIKDTADYSLPDAVRAQVRKWKRDMPPRWIEQRLTKGQCIVLLDGLDEVADASLRQQVVKWVENQMIAYGNNRFVLTSRPFGYRSNPLSGVDLLEVQPFTFGQVTQFVNSWYVANEIKSAVRDDPGVRMKAAEGGQDLLRRLRANPALSVLSVNPLLLTMIATVHRYRGALPGARVELYKDICEVFLGKRQQAHGIEQELRADQRQFVLQTLAYEMMCRERKEIAAAAAEQVIIPVLQQISTTLSAPVFLQSIEQIGGLLLEREQGIYAFAHLTFQEYLAAIHIRDNGLEHQLTKCVNESWWHETIRLYCAQSDASAIIAACLEGVVPSIASLVLALECLGEKRTIQPKVEQKLNQAINLDIESADPEHLRVIGEALLTLRLGQMHSLDERREVDTSLVTCVEYQLFLNDQRAQGIYLQPDHWKNAIFPRGDGRKPVLGVRASDAQAFCDWLTGRDVGMWSYRLPSIGELDGHHIMDMLPEETGCWANENEQWHLIMPKKITIMVYNDFVSTFNDIHTSAHMILKAREIEVALLRKRNLDFTRDLVREIERKLAREHNLARDLAFIRDFDRDLDRDRAFDFDRVLNRDLDRDLNRVLAIARDRARYLYRDLERSLNLEHSLNLARARNLDIALTRDLARDLARALDRDQAFESALNRDLARDLVSACTLVLTTDLYFLFSLLVERQNGRLPVYEGILLMRERQKEESSM